MRPCRHAFSAPFLAGFLLLPLLLRPAAMEGILVDKIAATVNEEIITLHDIERAVALFPVERRADEGEDDLYFRVLNDLVTYKVIALEYGDEFVPDEEDVEAVQTRILQKTGSLEALQATLGRFAMSWADFQAFLREIVLYEKVLREKFPMELIIPFEEIEKFYQGVYLPSHRQIGLEPLSLVEMTPQIEAYLRRQRNERRLNDWLGDLRSATRIEIKLRSPQ